MPQKRNPQSLQDLSLAVLTNFITNTGVYIAKTICDESKVKNDRRKRKFIRKNKVHSNTDLQPKQSLDIRLKGKSEVLLWVKNALCMVPHIFADKITRDLLVNGDNLYHSHNNTDLMNHNRCHEWINHFVKAGVHTSVKVLNFHELSSHIQELVCTQFVNIQKLHVLRLLAPSKAHLSIADIIERGIFYLRDLLSFSYNFDCTDEVLRQLSVHCKSLQALDMSCSSLVTQKSIPHIHKLKNLRYLNVNRTSLSEEFLVQMIAGLPCLLNLQARDSFITADTHHVFPALVSLSIIAEISAIPNICPNLVHLSMCPDSYNDDLSVLKALQNLQHLELNNCSFEESNVDGLLQNCGKRLYTLKFDDVDDIDALAVGMFCDNLHELAYNYCTFNVMLGGLPEIPYSTSLSILTLKTFRKDQFIRYLPILHYTHLHVLHVEGVKSFSKDLIYQAVSTNIWRHLRCLHIDNCGDITPECIKYLVDNCQNLSTLSGIINDRRLHTIKDYIRIYNFNIQLL